MEELVTSNDSGSFLLQNSSSGFLVDKNIFKSVQEPTLEENAYIKLRNLVMELQKEITKLKTKEICKELQLPEEIVKNSGIIKDVRRTKRGRGFSPLTKAEILDAQQKCMNAADAARYLNVNYYTYKKYAVMYGMWITLPLKRKSGLNIINPESGKYPVSKLIKGEFPEYSVFRLKEKLILGGIKKPECEMCGYKERRILDGKLPLLLNFLDGNHKNHKLENLKLLCYNCTFIAGTGYIRHGKKYHILDDPDRAQGSGEHFASKF